MSPASDSDAKRIEILEKINQIIDLCIDNGSYDTIKEMIPDGALYPGEGKERKNDHKKILEKLKAGPQVGETEEDFILNFSLGRSACPVRKILIPAVFREKFSENEILLDGKESLRPWSCLFWAKIIRAELLRQSRNPWLKLYDQVILYLEANIISCFPVDPSLKKQDFWWKTLFNYFMELTAVSTGEGSLGYAERAENELRGYDEITRAPYDRWIWYNKGIAYQHTRRQRDAVSHFNELTTSFFKEHPNFDVPLDVNTIVEFLLNIAPSIMQTAGIYIKEQLAYHALKSLKDQRLDDWLKNIKKCKNTMLMAHVVKQVELRRELLRLEALLRLDCLDDSKEIIEKLHPDINITDKQCLHDDVPWYNNLTNPPTINEIKFIEQKVMWYREEAMRLQETIRLQNDVEQKNNNADYCKKETVTKTKKALRMFIYRMNMVGNQYWSWVKDIPHDKTVYFSNWAEFLGIGMKITKLLKESTIYQREWDDLLASTLNLYKDHRQSLPGRGVTQKQNGNGRIKLEDLRSDNPFDIINGLNNFYAGMISIRPHLNGKKSKGAIKPFTWTKFYEELQHDHNLFLNALTEWDQKFGEHQRIEALKRCNERIKWVASNKTGNDCKTCPYFEKCIFPPFKEGIQNDDTVNSLVKDDYELIMEEAEEHFSKHLKDNSSHVPEARSLHFMGLQRWNSLTPAQGRSIGGGYFIYHTDSRGEVDLGIAIDPGFDFIRNLFRQGFSIRDIDIVLISHAHPDHLWDFESIVQLLHDLSQKNVDHNNHRINVILTSAAYSRYEHYVIGNPALRRFIEPFVIDLHTGQGHDDKESFCFKENISEKSESGKHPHRWKPVLQQSQMVQRNNKSNKSQDVSCEIEEIEITPTRAYHDDYSRMSDSYGIKLKFTFDEESKNLCIGYTGDTKWVSKDLYSEGCPIYTKCQETGCNIICPENIAHQYHDCEVLLMHLGSLIDHKKHNRFDFYDGIKECEKLIREKNHLYLLGMIRFLKALSEDVKIYGNNERLILISEFGEELQGGIRVNIVERLKKNLPPKWQMLPVDVGLDILLRTEKKSEGKEQPNETQGHTFICAMCNKPQPLKNIKFDHYGYDEAIFYLCRTCMKAKPWDVRQNRMRQLYETGKELKVLPTEKKLKEKHAQGENKVY